MTETDRPPGFSRHPAVFLLVALVPVACDGGSGGPAEGPAVEVVEERADVTLGERSVVIPPATFDEGLIARPEDGVYRFRAGMDEVEGLERGSVVLLGGEAVRRIDSVDRVDEELVLRTSPATLAELIRDGTIEWEADLDFRAGVAGASVLPRVSVAGRELAPAAASDGSVSYSGEIRGFDVELELEPAGDRLNVSLEGTRRLGGGARTGFTAEGWITNFVQRGRMEFSDHRLEDYGYSADGMEGEMELTFAAVDVGQESVSFVVPAKISLPFRVWMIPAEIGIGTSVTVKPQFHAHGSSEASLKVTYDSRHGMELEGGSVTAEGQLLDKKFEITDETVSASAAPVGMGLQVDFPLMELGILRGTVVTSFAAQTNVYSFYDPSIMAAGEPEQSGGIEFKGLVQAKLSALGLELTETHELWSERMDETLDP